MSHYTQMGAYPDQSARARKQARAARRLILAQKYEKRQRRIEAAKTVATVIVGAFFLYAFMWLAAAY